MSHNLSLLCAGNWQEELHKYISPDQLPQAYGGTRCEPDPWCTDYVSATLAYPLSQLDPPSCLSSQISHNTSDIPPECYLVNLTETSREEMERVVVGRGAAHKIRCEVTEAQSLLKWEFISVDYDIAFRVYHKGDGKQKEEVVSDITVYHDGVFVAISCHSRT